MSWPPSIMAARVVMLAKTELPPTDPLQLRPITITSRIYRTWSRYRSMQIAMHLQSMLPPEISSTAAGISADMLAATVLLEIEHAHKTNAPKLGATLDLVKCYNQIPRIPVLMALSKLGVPREYLTALASMFAQLERFLEIAGQVGTPSKSSTGVPEGCCFSTICMLGLAAWMSKTVESIDNEAQCVIYADNLEIIARSFCNLV